MNEIKTFQTYQEKSRALSFDEMRQIHEQIAEGIVGDTDAEELYEEQDWKRIGDFACHLAFVNGLNAR